MVSQDGSDEPQCLNYSLNAPCKTSAYPINQGFSAICLHGKFYKMSETIELSNITSLSMIHIFCKHCSIEYSEFNISCITGTDCSISFFDIELARSIFSSSNIYITFRNVTLKETCIQDLHYHDYPFENVNNQIYFEKSSVSCTEAYRCGFDLANIATKVSLVHSELYNFRIDIKTSQLIFAISNSFITMPNINYCPGNRTGTLCGACEEGFSISILTGVCTPDNH